MSTTATTVKVISPNSARRVRTDLKTSENIYLPSNFVGATRSRTSSPINSKLRPQHSTTVTACSTPQQQSSSNLQGRFINQDKLSDRSVKTTATAAAKTQNSSKSKRTFCKSSNIPMAAAMSTPPTVADTRKYIRRGNFVLTAAKHVVDDSRILSTSAPHEGSTYLSAHLPARATRLLNRSRMQQHCTLNNDDSDSAKSPLTARRRTNTASSRTSTASSTNNNNQTNNSANSSLQRKFAHHHHHHHHHHHQASSSYHQRETHSSSDDLMLYDKSFRNAMIQDVLQFKKQLLRLRKILQETETLNPFENDNGQLFTSCGLDSKLLDDIDLASLTSSTTDDPIQELADLRRQVVYLQGQVDDRDRTIRLQKNLIEKLEAEKLKAPHAVNEIAAKECVDTATQTERTRPLTIGTESLSRSKPEYTSYTTYFPAICSDSTTIIQHHQQNPACLANNQTRRHTIISTTLTNYNQQLSTPRHTPRRASIAWEKQTPSYKPVKITLIGDPLKHWQSEGNSLNKTKDEEFSKNFINTNLNRQQLQKEQQKQQENAHNIILNSKHHHRLQDIMVANELKTQTHSHQHQHQHQRQRPHNNQHHYNLNQMNQHHQQLQQQQQSHQFYKATSHQHNNSKPTVTIV